MEGLFAHTSVCVEYVPRKHNPSITITRPWAYNGSYSAYHGAAFAQTFTVHQNKDRHPDSRKECETGIGKVSYGNFETSFRSLSLFHYGPHHRTKVQLGTSKKTLRICIAFQTSHIMLLCMVDDESVCVIWMFEHEHAHTSVP